ncbi:T9SS type A sorting domain-containing protein, partial [bacterium]|nr:T9SS type A sorting domain-containing protein [bacterium]
ANGDSCDVYNNIFMDPLFYATAGDSAYHLTELSPCIDAGDPLSPFDPDSTIADMGAYYFHHELGLTQDRQIEIPDEFCLLPAYPNPFNPSTTIRFGLPTASEVSLSIYNIRGERVADLVNGYRLAGYHDVTWEAGGLASGMYFCRFKVSGEAPPTYGVKTGDFTAIRKVMLVK